LYSYFSGLDWTGLDLSLEDSLDLDPDPDLDFTGLWKDLDLDLDLLDLLDKPSGWTWTLEALLGVTNLLTHIFKLAYSTY